MRSWENHRRRVDRKRGKEAKGVAAKEKGRCGKAWQNHGKTIDDGLIGRVKRGKEAEGIAAKEKGRGGKAWQSWVICARAAACVCSNTSPTRPTPLGVLLGTGTIRDRGRVELLRVNV